MGWPLLFTVLQIDYSKRLLKRDGTYTDRPFPHRNASDNSSLSQGNAS